MPEEKVSWKDTNLALSKYYQFYRDARLATNPILRNPRSRF